MNPHDDSSRTLPKRLVFHYTSQAGLLGIVSSKTIRATNILYLNDAREIEVSIELTRQRIEQLRTPASAKDNDVLDAIASMITMASSTADYSESTFACSFCEDDGNNLNQWRGYCPEGNGFSIGFDLKELGRIVNRYGFRVAKCIYDEQQQREIINKYVDESLASIKASFSEPFDRQFAIQSETYSKFLRIAATLKQCAFKDENEWRLISRPMPLSQSDDSRIRFREGRSTIIPYFEVPVVEEGHCASSFSTIWIGPTLDKKLARQAMKRLLWTNGIDCPIMVSDILYRPRT